MSSGDTEEVTSLQKQSSVAGSDYSGSDRRQVTGTASGAAIRLCEDVMVTSGSLSSQLAGESTSVKGKPIKSVRSTLDTRCLTGMEGSV